MSSKRLIIGDRLSFSDTAEVKTPATTLWAKTEVIAGYGFNNGGLGKSYLNETLFEEENTVPIGGVQSAFQYIFGARGPITIPTLYDRSGIGSPNITVSTSYLSPNHKVENDPSSEATRYQTIYNPGHFVQLFGVGVTGTAENNISVHKVGYREMFIDMDGDETTGKPNGIMYPFRYTASELDGSEKTKYFGKKLDPETGAIGYYLKRFESVPVIKHVWKTQDNIDEDTEIHVTDATLEDNTRNDAIQSFVEMHLQITKKDLKEFFADKLEQPESCRFNCIALFDGYYTEEGKPMNELFGDYSDVRLFSKVNIPTEHLSLQKDLEILYRVYGS